MSSPSASTSLISLAVLAARAYVPKLDMFLASLANIGPGADQKMVVGVMKVFKKWLWHKGQAVDITWSRENELQEWCMARYMENSGAPWLASFEANFAPVPLSIDEHLASLLADDGPFSLWTELSPDSKVAAYVEPLVQLDLARQECMWAEAAAQSAAIMSAEREAELLAERQVALAEHLAKHIAEARAARFLEAEEEGAASGGDAVETGETAAGSAVAAVKAVAEPVDESEAPEDENHMDDEVEAPSTPKKVLTVGGSGRPPAQPTATLFTDAQLRNLLVPRRDEVVLDADRRAGESVPGLKGKKTVSLSARRDFKLQKGSCDKCWADNDPEGCWYPTGAQPCYRCDALKRACTLSGRKSRERHNFEKAVLVRRAREFVIAQRTLATTGSTTSLSAASLALPTTQELGIAVDVAVPEPATPKGKAKARYCKSESGQDRPLSGTPVAGPSRQIIPVDPVEPILRPGGVVLSELESLSGAEVPSEHEEEAESSDVSESPLEVPAVSRCVVQPNYAPLPIPRVDGQEFLWLGKTLDYPISALRPTQYIEAAKEKAAGMAEVMRKDMQAAAVEMEGLRLRKKIMERSVDILERYQADCTEALEWREANEAHLQQPFATLFPLPPGASLDP
ncbi:hypothetical protein C0992_007505 [Termitomyces sp. T32_za158]|nr:hypothetical protein C0992_007505 [Termitomyces sp. T32_za158]